MLDIRFVRDNRDSVKRMLEQRGYDMVLHPLLALDEQR